MFHSHYSLRKKNTKNEEILTLVKREVGYRFNLCELNFELACACNDTEASVHIAIL